MTSTAIQLYTLRRSTDSLSEIIRSVADNDFDGIEFANRITTASVTDIRDAIDATGIVPMGAHVDLDRLDRDLEAIVDRFDRIGCTRFVVPHIGSERFRTPRHADDLAVELCETADRLRDRGCRLGIHTTREQFLPIYGRDPRSVLLQIDGLPRGGYNHLGWAAAIGRRRNDRVLEDRTPIGHLLDVTAQAQISLEIDLKAVVTAGFPIDVVLDTFADRTDAVHLSDVRRSRRFPPDYSPVTPGQGVLDVRQALEAIASRDLDWCVFEHDDPPDPSVALTELSELRSGLPVSVPPAELSSMD